MKKNIITFGVFLIGVAVPAYSSADPFGSSFTHSKTIAKGLDSFCQDTKTWKGTELLSKEDLNATLTDLSSLITNSQNQLPTQLKYNPDDFDDFNRSIDGAKRFPCSTLFINHIYEVTAETYLRIKIAADYSGTQNSSLKEIGSKIRVLQKKLGKHLDSLIYIEDYDAAEVSYPDGPNAFMRSISAETSKENSK